MTTLWQGLENPNFKTLLTESRLQLHYAIQFIAAAGAALAEPLPDYSHTSLTWNPDLQLFVGSAIQAASPFQVALDPIRLTVLLLNPHGDAIASLPLEGKTMTEGLRWLQQEIANLGADASKIGFLDYPPDDFPNHPLADNAAFAPPQHLALGELVAYYADTHLLLQAIVSTNEDASSIRIWPHHFDMATLIMLPGLKQGTPLTIGVGLSPGDTSYSEPYWYVSPYPYPNTEALPALEGHGFWHTRSWVGAVLPASHLSETIRPEAQKQQVEAFLQSALKTSSALLTCEAPAQV